MQTNKKFFDDMAKLAGSGFNVMQEMRKEIEHYLQHCLGDVLKKFQFVERSEFEELKAMVAKLRLEQEAQKKTKQTPNKPTTRKSVAKKTAATKPKSKLS